ncbi:hypothetical protein ACSMFR_02340 [Listeria aquatica]|uniref:hypothetical protein n=1 Tax=Listeria aquatica TaxID=1494960 RepID=UPI003F6EFE3C
MKRFLYQLNFLIMIVGVSFIVINFGYVFLLSLGFGLTGFTLVNLWMLYALFLLIYKAFKKPKEKQDLEKPITLKVRSKDWQEEEK